MQVIVRFGLLVLLVSLFVCNLHAQALTASTVAGNGIAAFAGDGGPPTLASLASPQGVAVDGAGNIYVADTFNNRIRKVSLAGVITTIAGNGTPGFSGDGDAAPTGQISGPVDVASDATGTFLYIADQGNNRVRRVYQGFMTTANALQIGHALIESRPSSLRPLPDSLIRARLLRDLV